MSLTITPTTATSSIRLPTATYVLATGVFLMGTTEFVVAGVLPDIARSLGIPVATTGLMITVFAIGMILTLRLPPMYDAQPRVISLRGRTGHRRNHSELHPHPRRTIPDSTRHWTFWAIAAVAEQRPPDRRIVRERSAWYRASAEANHGT